uniref:Uncharacterized protein n=1 Tax=Candidatus Kentrum sp. MB TaxID=2138164 RepID=A0A450X1I5_9GAMM|nr:MAG: hypothetical protein BECKMB1821G_GA0114241_100415 [Candidatus Kentron sp. MB]
MDILIYLGIGIVILVAILIWRFIKRRTLFYRAKKEGTVADARPTLEEKKEWKEREEEQPCFKISPLRSPPSRKERKKRKKGKRRENLSSFSISVGQAAARRKTPPPHELTASESVRFRAFWPCKMFPDAWQSLFVYIFSGEEGHRGVQSDFRRRKTAPADSYDFSSSSACQDIRRGTEILVCPELEGARFNPPFAKVIWLEDWHCVEFRMQAERPLNADRGRVAFYVGPVLIGEMIYYETADALSLSGVLEATT